MDSSIQDINTLLAKINELGGKVSAENGFYVE